jgi:hypothetical protein
MGTMVRTSINVNSEIWAEFQRIAKDADKCASQEIRKFMLNYVADNKTKTK